MHGTRALPSSARSLSKAFMRISVVTLFLFSISDCIFPSSPFTHHTRRATHSPRRYFWGQGEPPTTRLPAPCVSCASITARAGVDMVIPERPAPRFPSFLPFSFFPVSALQDAWSLGRRKQYNGCTRLVKFSASAAAPRRAVPCDRTWAWLLPSRCARQHTEKEGPVVPR